MVSSRGRRCRRRGASRRARGRDAVFRLLGVRLVGDGVGAGLGGFGGELAEAAGAAVGGVLPGAGQPGDDRGAAAADDQGEPGGELADHVRGGDVVAAGVLLAADIPGHLAAQLGGRVERGGVGDAGQVHLDRAGVQDDLAAVVAPAAGQLGFAVHDGDHLDALAAGNKPC
jgi:hypothetical protein